MILHCVLSASYVSDCHYYSIQLSRSIWQWVFVGLTLSAAVGHGKTVVQCCTFAVSGAVHGKGCVYNPRITHHQNSHFHHPTAPPPHPHYHPGLHTVLPTCILFPFALMHLFLAHGFESLP